MSSIGNITNLSEAYDTEYDARDFKRGEIYYVDFEDIGYANKHVTSKRRPAVIIQNNKGNECSSILIVALITSAYKKPDPFQYTFNLNGRESTIMFEQIFTIDKFRVLEKCGELTYEQMKQADDTLMFSLALNRLSLENVMDINVVSLLTKRTKTYEKVYFEVQIDFANNQHRIINIELDKVKEFDKTISKDTDFDELKHKFDCCRGLNWLVNNSEI